jgi:tetratricopeptide (TPR) repeat protein
LKRGKVYSLKTSYQYGEKEYDIDQMEFKESDYPNKEVEPEVSQSFSFPYNDEMKSGNLMVQGVATNPSNGKFRETPKLKVAEGVITTSMLVRNNFPTATADHGYNNQEELEPVNVDFFFDQGRSNLRRSERSSERGDFLDAFIAGKNVTRTVTIIGTHSPEGAERINNDLAADRAGTIEKYYRETMDKYDYMGAADSINFILKPIIEDWTDFKAALTEYTGISDAQKSEFFAVVDGAGSFEDKERRLKRLSGYRSVFRDVYPPLRTAKTEILKVKEKKTDAEIAVLAKQMGNGSTSMDALSDEELGYAATLTPSLKEKEDIYTAATKKNDSWASHNNLGAVYLEMAKSEINEQKQNDLLERAITQLQLSNTRQSNPEATINLASAYAMAGDVAQALNLINRAEGMQSTDVTSQVLSGVKGALLIKNGKYYDAINALARAEETSANLFNKGLAQLLNKDYLNALTSLTEAVNMDEGNALAYYVAAITNARLEKSSPAIANLSKAISADGSLKAMAAGDLEFRNIAGSEDFMNLMR